MSSEPTGTGPGTRVRAIRTCSRAGRASLVGVAVSVAIFPCVQSRSDSSRCRRPRTRSCSSGPGPTVWRSPRFPTCLPLAFADPTCCSSRLAARLRLAPGAPDPCPRSCFRSRRSPAHWMPPESLSGCRLARWGSRAPRRLPTRFLAGRVAGRRRPSRPTTVSGNLPVVVSWLRTLPTYCWLHPT